jgi:hypothetical protein
VDVLYLRGMGVPDSIVATSKPSPIALPNFDPWRDDQPGIVLQRGGGGPGEAAPEKYQQWWTGSGGYLIEGDTTLYLWSAVQDFGNGLGSATAYLRECSDTGADCSVIARRSLTSLDWQLGTDDFAEAAFEFGQLSHEVVAGRRLAVKIIVDAVSSENMWFAYATQRYDSRLVVTEGTATTTTTTATSTTTTATTTTTTTTTSAPPTAPPTTSPDPTGPTTTIGGPAPPTTLPTPVTTLPRDLVGLTPTTSGPPTTIAGVEGTPPEQPAEPQLPTDEETVTRNGEPEASPAQAPVRIGPPGASGRGSGTADRFDLPSLAEREAAMPSFVVVSDEPLHPRSPLQHVGIVFKSFVENLGLNLLPAVLLGLFTALLVLRGVDLESPASGEGRPSGELSPQPSR